MIGVYDFDVDALMLRDEFLSSLFGTFHARDAEQISIYSGEVSQYADFDGVVGL
jgi:hypothetical protein